jgi:hypothetical protein
MQFASRRQHLLRCRAIAVVLARFVFVGQMMRQLGCQHALSQHLLELPGQSGFTQNGLGILVLHCCQQLIDQFDRKRGRRFLLLWFLGGHYVGHGISLSVLFHDPALHKKSDRLRWS